MSAREDILAAVKRAKPAPERGSAAVGRQALIPPRFVREHANLAALFVQKLAAVGTSCTSVPDAAEVPAAITAWLDEAELGRRFVIAGEPFLSELAWSEAGLEPEAGAPDPLRPATIVSGAFAGVAETGSLAFLTNGASRPSHNILAESHIVVLQRSQILPAIEDVWREARGRLPRSISFVTGASRTADIEMAMELGVHGAVRMHVILVG